MATVQNSFDVIVIGIGSMGASACYYLSKQGYKVLGLEQFDIAHELGSHAGQSRIVRKAYFEDPDYVPLLTRAYENWKAFEKETKQQLYYRTGLVYFGKPDDILIKGVKESALLYDISLEKISVAAATKRFPQFEVPIDFNVLFEPDAGFVPPEKTIRLYAKKAVYNGARLYTHEKVISWKKEGNGIIVTTGKNNYHCDKLIITAGAWAGKMIPGFSNTIQVTRQFVCWIKVKHESYFSMEQFPCWMIADEDKHGAYYGFPILSKELFGEPVGLKLAHHYPSTITNPDHVNRQPTKDDIDNIHYALDTYLPNASGEMIASKICLYANSADENFIIDHLPGYEGSVAIACGFSGHGFKFVPVVGEILADLVIKGKTELPIQFLRATRFIK